MKSYSFRLDEECIDDLGNKSLLIVKGEADASVPNDDDSLGIHVPKFDLRQNVKLEFSAGEEENIELDKRCKDDLEDKSSLIIKGETDAPGAKADNDSGGGNSLEFEILGSDSAEIVVDDADIKKLEDIENDKDLKKNINKYGLKNITSVLKDNVTAWKSKPLNIAVAGESGKGKSSFINAFRGISDEEEGAAEVDEKECTKGCRAFRHPLYDNFVLWEVPGLGTQTFPKEDYLKTIQIDRFDFFIIISCTRFSELEYWLAKNILERKKRLYFIRNKIDTDMSNKKKRFKNRVHDFCEKDEFDKMKADISQELNSDFKVEKLPFFMISSHHPDKYDFPSVLNKLLQDVPTAKKDAMVFGLAGMSKDIIEEKASALRSRIWKVVLLSGIGNAIPIPFLSAGIETALILKEVRFYREQFGLDDQSLTHLADMAGMSLDHLKSCVDFKTPAAFFTSEGLTTYFMNYYACETAKTVLMYVIPEIGVKFYCEKSYFTAMTILKSILENMKQDALKVLVYVTTTGGTETEIH